MTIRNLDALIEPRAVAVIGASPQPGSVGAMITRNILSGGFGGAVHLVNPRHSTILGRPVFKSLEDIGSVPDLAVIATPAATVPSLVAEVTRAGCRAAAVITAGLDGNAKQQMLEAARPGLVRVLGPNSIGLMLPAIGLNASFSHRAPLKGDLAFLSQSGALVTAVVDWACARGIGFSQVLSLGDMADIDFGDMIDYLAGDIRSRAILIYMEAVTQAPKFMSAVRRAARAKPVIVIKSGRHATAARAAQSHTGRLAGMDAAYDAAFRRAGALRVFDLAGLFDAAEVLARVPRLSGERLAILTNGGGAGVLAADDLADRGGVLAELSPGTIAHLDQVLPPAWSRSNPIDIIGDAGPERYEAALAAVLADPGCDAVLAIDCPTALASGSEIAMRVADTYDRSGRRKALLTNWLGAGAASEARALFAARNIATFETPDAAVGGFMNLVDHGRAQDALMRTPPAAPAGERIDEDAGALIVDKALAAGGGMLSEADSKALLAAYGVPVAASIVVATGLEAASRSRALIEQHGAVVLKILSADITHKSDVGGVALALVSPEAVEAAADAMMARVAEVKPGARIQGFTLSPMIRRPLAYELIVGLSVDPTFGPLVLFGAGGTAVEAMADTALALPPLDLALARDLIGRTRISRLLGGFRDRKAADLDAVAGTLVKLSALACRHPEIREIDINPLLADSAGVIALDARVRVSAKSAEPLVPMAIRPYPAGWERKTANDRLGGLLIRPIRPNDEALYERFFEHVTMHDRRLRFFAAQKDLPQRLVARLTQIDYAREIAFVALAEATGDLLGVSRFAADPDYERAEYAVLVRSDLKGVGLGWLLMRQLIDYATATGLKELYGSVLAENTTMLGMCADLGFTVASDPDDVSLKLVSLRLAA